MKEKPKEKTGFKRTFWLLLTLGLMPTGPIALIPGVIFIYYFITGD